MENKTLEKPKYIAYMFIAFVICGTGLTSVEIIAKKIGEVSALRQNHTTNIYCSEPEFLKQLNEINLFNDETPYCIHIQQQKEK